MESITMGSRDDYLTMGIISWLMAVAPWEVLRRGRRQWPWLGRYCWFLCVCEMWSKNCVATDKK